MKALILKDDLRFNYEEAPVPEPGAGEVLVAVKACGICGSDVHGMDGSTGICRATRDRCALPFPLLPEVGRADFDGRRPR